MRLNFLEGFGLRVALSFTCSVLTTTTVTVRAERAKEISIKNLVLKL